MDDTKTLLRGVSESINNIEKSIVEINTSALNKNDVKEIVSTTVRTAVLEQSIVCSDRFSKKRPFVSVQKSTFTWPIVAKILAIIAPFALAIFGALYTAN